MNRLIEYEDFLPDVRTSLYRKAQVQGNSNENMDRKMKKIKFNTTDPNISDSINGSKSEFSNSEKIKSRKKTPVKKKLKKEPVMEKKADSSSRQPQKHKHLKQKTPKKKQVVISFSSSSDSFDEELKDTQLTPSKSELETFQNNINKSSKRKSSDMIGSSSEDEGNGSGDNFDLQMFFNTRELSELNESVTEAHSGIDHEFVNDYANDVKIVESESLYTQKEAIKIDTDNVDESDKDVSEDNVSECSTEKIELIANKIQESVVICDDKQGTSVSSLEDDRHSLEEKLLKENGFTSFEEIKNFQEEELSGNYRMAEYYDYQDKKVVVLNENQSISFYGLFTLKVLYGKVEVLGSILESNSNEVNLYSPRGSALLYIKNVTHHQDSEEHIKINQLFSTQDSLEADIFVDANSAVILCSKLEDTKLLFVEKYISQKIFPRLENDSVPQVIFEPTGNTNTIKQSSDWDEVLSSVTWDSKLMITGGKGVGKSTLLRFAINRLLNKFDKVRVLDLDPGQSEFTVPGCISVVTITEPIFGPNFTHLKWAHKSILSNINVGQDPRAYLNCIKSIVSYMDMLEGEFPTLINYMGFVHGIGLNIVASAIKYIQPTGIIQICSKNPKKNFQHDLTYNVVNENCTLLTEDHKMYLDYLKLKYKLYKVPSMNDESDGWTLEPRQSREMYVLAYFGQLMLNGVDYLTSSELPMYEINLSSIKITNLEGEQVAYAVANANMVALCSLETESNIFRCMGYGVVRGIDLEDNKLVLVTPEKMSVLEDVYYLVTGNVFLPPAVYMSSDDVPGIIPYVMEGELVSFGQITKRSYLPANKK